MDIGRIVGNTEDWESVKSVLAKQNIAGDGLTDLVRLRLDYPHGVQLLHCVSPIYD